MPAFVRRRNPALPGGVLSLTWNLTEFLWLISKICYLCHVTRTQQNKRCDSARAVNGGRLESKFQEGKHPSSDHFNHVGQLITNLPSAHPLSLICAYIMTPATVTAGRPLIIYNFWWITLNLHLSRHFITHRSAGDWITVLAMQRYSTWFNRFSHYEGSCEIKELAGFHVGNTLMAPISQDSH